MRWEYAQLRTYCKALSKEIHTMVPYQQAWRIVDQMTSLQRLIDKQQALEQQHAAD